MIQIESKYGRTYLATMPKAAKVLERYIKQGSGDAKTRAGAAGVATLTAAVFYTLLSLVSAQMGAPGWWYGVMLVLGIIGIIIGTYVSTPVAFQRAVARGHIIEVDTFLVQIWDELARADGLVLGDQARARALLELPNVATNLADELATYHRCVWDLPETSPTDRNRVIYERQVMEARLRAAVAQQVQRLKLEQDGQQELLAGMPSLGLPTPDEVQAQLQFVQQREAKRLTSE